jgi:hypothetical protein
MLESYFRNNADLGTGLLMARSAITSPHFFPYRLQAPRLLPLRAQLRNLFLHLKITSPVLKVAHAAAFHEEGCANISDLSTVRTKMSHLEI